MSHEHSLTLRTDSPLDAAVVYLATALFALTIALAAVQVGVRLLSVQSSTIPLHWTEPLARITLIITTYLGAAVATRNREHIRMSFVTDRLTARAPRVGAALDVLSSLLVLLFALIVTRGTLTMAGNMWTAKFGSVSVVTSGMIYAGIALGFVLIAVYEVANLVGAVRTLRADKGSTQPAGGASDAPEVESRG